MAQVKDPPKLSLAERATAARAAERERHALKSPKQRKTEWIAARSLLHATFCRLSVTHQGFVNFGESAPSRTSRPRGAGRPRARRASCRRSPERSGDSGEDPPAAAIGVVVGDDDYEHWTCRACDAEWAEVGEDWCPYCGAPRCLR